MPFSTLSLSVCLFSVWSDKLSGGGACGIVSDLLCETLVLMAASTACAIVFDSHLRNDWRNASPGFLDQNGEGLTMALPLPGQISVDLPRDEDDYIV